jgi:hypothetical protein
MIVNGHNLPEYGITHTVRTCSSRRTLKNILNAINSGKTNGVIGWLAAEGIRPENCLIIGSYLTGSGVANRLAGQSSVTVLDIYPHLKCLLHPAISFATHLDQVTDRDWDLVLDTSGLGGIPPGDIQRIRCSGGFLVEDPTSDGSDGLIQRTSRYRELAGCTQAAKRGVLRTWGLKSKTSGTMTLSLEVLRRAMADALRKEGVLYSTAPLEFSERILFHEKDPERFFENLERPALVVSSLKDVDCDAILWSVLSRLQSRVDGFPGGEVHEGRFVFQTRGGKNTLGSVVGGRSGWFYRPG